MGRPNGMTAQRVLHMEFLDQVLRIILNHPISFQDHLLLFLDSPWTQTETGRTSLREAPGSASNC